jgi:hypothetical protein
MQFIDTKFMTADEKTKTYHALVRFIDSGCRRERFTKQLYHYLSLNFSFIAHRDIDGFWSARFGDPSGLLHTIDQIRNAARWSLAEDQERPWDLNRVVRDLMVVSRDKIQACGVTP